MPTYNGFFKEKCWAFEIWKICLIVPCIRLPYNVQVPLTRHQFHQHIYIRLFCANGKNTAFRSLPCAKKLQRFSVHRVLFFLQFAGDFALFTKNVDEIDPWGWVSTVPVTLAIHSSLIAWTEHKRFARKWVLLNFLWVFLKWPNFPGATIIFTIYGACNELLHL
jgi:hypothetical protein